MLCYLANNDTTRSKLMPPVIHTRISHPATHSVNPFTMFKRGFFNVKKPAAVITSQDYQDSDGNTPLHHLAKNYKNFDCFYRSIEQIGEEPASVMARTVNNKGYLPINLLVFKMHYYREQAMVDAVMFKLMTNVNVKPIAEPINIDEILKRYYPLKHEPFYPLIQPMCKIANEVRETLKEASTHPQYNNYSVEKQEKIRNTILGNRYGESGHPLIDMYDNAQIAANARMGNCYEFTNLFLYKLVLKPGLHVNSDRCEFINADHVFPLVRTPQDKELFKGNGSLICDALYGDVYPPSEMKQRLYAYRKFFRHDNRRCNVLTFFNPNYHKLESTLHIDDKDRAINRII